MKTQTRLITTLLLLPFFVIAGAQEIAPKADDVLRVMCYNVKHCRGMDNVIDYQRVADVINNMAPDVVALQELDSVTGRSNHANTIMELAGRTGMFAVFGGAIDYDGGRYGIGVLSKEKPLSYQVFPLPGQGEERALLVVEYEDHYIASTHFALRDSDRMASIPLIFEAVEHISKPLILGGDMNCGYDSAPQKLLYERFTMLSDTLPVGGRRRVIDFVYGYNNGNTYNVTQKMIQEERMASDHFPLFVDIQINKE